MVVLAVVIWRLGTGPFLAGLKAVDARAVVEVAGVVLVTTLLSAWRWTVVARGLGVPLSLPAAVAAYYRCLFLNLTLPGGVVGDIHRGVRHGREVHDVGRALRAVAWERAAGQVVQAVMTIWVLLVLPSPVRPSMPFVAGAAVALGLGIAFVCRMRMDAGSTVAWFRDTVVTDIRKGIVRRNAFPALVLISALVVAGHVVTFVIAARTVGVILPVSRLVPLALLALSAMVLPSVGGWGPREGVTAWTFAAAGLGAGRGAATAVAYGVLVLGASLPGAIVLAGGLLFRRRAPKPRTRRRVVRPSGAADA